MWPKSIRNNHYRYPFFVLMFGNFCQKYENTSRAFKGQFRTIIITGSGKSVITINIIVVITANKLEYLNQEI